MTFLSMKTKLTALESLVVLNVHTFKKSRFKYYRGPSLNTSSGLHHMVGVTAYGARAALSRHIFSLYITRPYIPYNVNLCHCH